MEVEYDPTDRGLPWLPSDDEDGWRSPSSRRHEDPGPSGPASAERVIERTRGGSRFARTLRSGRLRERCEWCQAGPRQWCRRAGRERAGFVHDSRGVVDTPSGAPH